MGPTGVDFLEAVLKRQMHPCGFGRLMQSNISSNTKGSEVQESEVSDLNQKGEGEIRPSVAGVAGVAASSSPSTGSQPL